MSTSETNFACSLANPIIRSTIKQHVTEIKWDSILARKVVDLFSGETISGSGKVPDATIRAYLSAENLLENEIEGIIAKCSDYQDLGKDIEGFVSSFSTFYKRKMVGAILEESNKNPEDMASEIVRRIGSLKKIESNIVPIRILGDLDVKKVIEDDLGGKDSILPTSFNLIKKSMPQGGYIRGQVVQVVGSPGTGKTLFCMNEAIEMAKAGFKGVYFALGDLMTLDLIVRCSAIITGKSLTECQISPETNWTNEVQSILKNLKIVVVSAGYMDPDTLADTLESRIQEEENVDFVIVDYDSNFAKTKESMYEEGDVVYNKMSMISRPIYSKYRLVIVASQPKQNFWSFEILPLESAAESSRKQAIIDVMVTFGKAKGSARKCGIMNLPKNRRGTSDIFTPYQMEDCGRLTELEQGEYNLIKGFSSEDKIDNKFKKNNYESAQK